MINNKISDVFLDKYEIAEILREMAILIELIDPYPKKGIAYRRAASSLEMVDNFQELAQTKNWEILPGIGKKISQNIQLLIENGRFPYYEYLKKEIPKELLELVHIPGLNLSKIKFLYESLHITSLEDLQKALDEKKLIGIKGFGPSFINKLETRVHRILTQGHIVLFPRGKHISDALMESLKLYAERVALGGDVRRLLETVASLPFIAVTNNAKKCLKHFKEHRFIDTVLQDNLREVVVTLKQGLRASLNIVSREDFALSYLNATGSDLHLMELKKESYKVLQNSHFNDEKEIYRSLGLHFIPPELREGHGEVEAAKNYDFSDLIEEKDLKGTFHCHTKDSDGHHSIEEMAEAAQKKGWSYIGIADHSKSSILAHGLSEERLRAQIEHIRTLNGIFFPSFKIFSGVECDILQDGQLDFSDALLKELDFVIISIHSLFKQEKEVMTKRLIRAIENPYTTMVGHVTGRLLRLRDPYAIDIEKVIDACIANNKIMELNAYPSRMDMDWRMWIKARGRGLKCSINPDAHSIYDLSNCTYGVYSARKGWVKKKDVINTLSLKEMDSYLKARNTS